MNVNLDQFFEAQKPTITIFGKSYAVDDDYKKVVGMQQFGQKVDQTDETGGLHAMLEYVLVDGKAAADEILAHHFSFTVYSKIASALTAAMTGKPIEDVEKAAQDAQAGARFPAGKGKRV